MASKRTTLSAPQIRKFRRHIFSWWKKHRRDLPWRHTNDPYAIMVSEVMLQQTQVARVMPVYAAFLTAWPTVYDLARASSAAVLRAWKGMGYNRRALYLQRTAQVVSLNYQGKFPTLEKELIQLPGLGRYTARAIMVFAQKQDVSMVDTNIRQIITHFFFDKTPRSEREVEDIADQLVPKGKSWEWHQALMDYGALALPRTPRGGRSTSVPFHQSNRFYRGKVVDWLRIRPLTRMALLSRMKREFGQPSTKTEAILSGLQKDGLITKTSTQVFRLPEE